MNKYNKTLEIVSVCAVGLGVISFSMGKVEVAVYEIALGIYAILVASYDAKKRQRGEHMALRTIKLNGETIIIDVLETDHSNELKKVNKCRRWEICSKCKDIKACQQKCMDDK